MINAHQRKKKSRSMIKSLLPHIHSTCNIIQKNPYLNSIIFVTLRPFIGLFRFLELWTLCARDKKKSHTVTVYSIPNKRYLLRDFHSRFIQLWKSQHQVPRRVHYLRHTLWTICMYFVFFQMSPRRSCCIGDIKDDIQWRNWHRR